MKVRRSMASRAGRAIIAVMDGILDSGMLEQLTEEAWYSPFPRSIPFGMC